MAALHARSMNDYEARTLALLDSPDQFSYELAPGEPMGPEDRRLLWDACRALLYTCKVCQTAKPIDEWDRDSHGCDLCVSCYDAAGLENEHSDGYHDDTPDPNCPDCQLTTAG